MGVTTDVTAMLDRYHHLTLERFLESGRSRSTWDRLHESGPLVRVHPGVSRLAAIEPHADDWWSTPPEVGTSLPLSLPDAEATRAYLLETLECTLELLDRATESDAGLYFYRLALFHEDLCGEALVVIAQTLGLPIGVEPPPAVASREPLLMPATRWTLASKSRRTGEVASWAANGGSRLPARRPAPPWLGVRMVFSVM